MCDSHGRRRSTCLLRLRIFPFSLRFQEMIAAAMGLIYSPPFLPSFLPINIASNTVASLGNRLRRPTASSSAGAAEEKDMKVQCEVCTAEAASVFCCADEAALCDSCDRRVHGANRLAGKHRRFSLLHPSSSAQPPPLCDVCKVRRCLASPSGDGSRC